MLGAGVIGLGVGMNHCRGYVKSEHAKLIAVCDLLDERLNRAKQEFRSIDLYKDYKELLKRKDIQVISVATPPFLHAEIAMEAIEKGKHVMLEKPMALTIEDCERLIKAAEKKGVKFSVNVEFKVNPLYREIKDLIDQGEIGKVAAFSIYYWRRPFRAPSKPGKWPGQSKYAGSMVFEEVVHWFDLLRWYAGDVKSVYSLGNDWVRKEFDYDQTIFINLECENGAIGQISQTICGFEMRGVIWVIGTKAAVLAETIYSPTGNRGVRMLKPHQKNIEDDVRMDIINTRYYGEEIYELHSIEDHVREFVRCIVEDREPPVTCIEGKKDVELALAVEKSARERNPVKLPLNGTPRFAIERLCTEEDIKNYYASLQRTSANSLEP